MKRIKIYFFTFILAVVLGHPPLLHAQNRGGSSCSNAYTVTVSPTSGCIDRIEGENTSIASPAVVNPPCDKAGINRDLWYSFVAPSNGEVALLVDLLTAFRVEGAIYTACPTNGGPNTSVFCNNTGLSGQIVKGLTPGATYFLQLWSDDFATGTFSFCLSETEALGQQDECATPIYREVLNVGGCTVPQPDYIGDNFGATNDPNLPIPSCGSYGQGKDVWYAAVVPPSGQLYAEVGDAGGPNDWVMAAYAGTCSTLNEIDCNDDTNNFFPALSLNGLVPGDTVLFRIWPYGGQDEGPFILLILDPHVYAPLNDNCDGAEALTLVNTDLGCSFYKSCGSNLGATPSNAPTPGCGIFDGAGDVWYSVIVPSGGDLELTCSENTPGGNSSWSIAAYNGTCNALSLMGCAEGSFVNYPTLSLNGINPGDTIYVRVSDNGSSSAGNFYLCAKTSGSLFALHFENNAAYPMESGNKIEWTFAQSPEEYQFQIERSITGEEWGPITVSPIQRSKGREYFTIDPTPARPVAYYRIVALSAEGQPLYSSIMSVVRTEDIEEDKVFPIPVVHILHVSTPLQVFGDNIHTEVFDLSGRKWLTDQHALQEEALLSLPVASLPANRTYILHIVGTKNSKTYKFIK